MDAAAEARHGGRPSYCRHWGSWEEEVQVDLTDVCACTGDVNLSTINYNVVIIMGVVVVLSIT
jgi:hypothetical protein